MDAIEAFARTADWTERLLAGTTPDRHDLPTPCTEWDVGALVNHILGGVQLFNLVMGRQPVPGGDPPADLVGDDPAGAYRAGVDAYLSTLADPVALEGTVSTPLGELPAAAFVGISLIDATAHAWDLATATGQDATIPAEVLAVVDQLARQLLAGMPRSPGTIADPVPVPATASDQDRFIAFLGRHP